MEEGLDECDLISQYKKRFYNHYFSVLTFMSWGLWLKGSDVLCLIDIVFQTGMGRCSMYVVFIGLDLGSNFIHQAHL